MQGWVREVAEAVAYTTVASMLMLFAFMVFDSVRSGVERARLVLTSLAGAGWVKRWLLGSFLALLTVALLMALSPGSIDRDGLMTLPAVAAIGLAGVLWAIMGRGSDSVSAGSRVLDNLSPDHLSQWHAKLMDDIRRDRLGPAEDSSAARSNRATQDRPSPDRPLPTS